MFDLNMKKFQSDKFRLLQVICLLALTVFALLTAFIDNRVMQGLAMLSGAGVAFFSIVPVYLSLLSADTGPLPRTGLISLKGAECAGIAGVGIVIIAAFTGLGMLFGKTGPILVGAVFVVQALAGIGMAVGAGLTNLLRTNDIELEAPPPPPPPAVEPQPADPYAQQQQGYPPQQQGYPPQEQQGYPPQQQQGYPPQGGGYDQGGQQ